MPRFTAAGIGLVVVALVVAVAWSVAGGPGGPGSLVGVDEQDGPVGGTGCSGAATIEGTLDSNASWVITGSVATDGWHVVWPRGYNARQTAEGLELLNQDGNVVARVGDRVHVAGSDGTDGRWLACRDTPTVLSP